MGQKSVVTVVKSNEHTALFMTITGTPNASFLLDAQLFWTVGPVKGRLQFMARFIEHRFKSPCFIIFFDVSSMFYLTIIIG